MSQRKRSINSRSERGSAKGERIGIFGGTFDPVHLGHLIAAQEAAESMHLDRVLFVPSGRPPHKRGRSLSPAADRLGMVRMAIRGDARFACSDAELRTQCASYTVATLERLKKEHRGSRLFLLIGLDQAALLSTWRKPERLFALAKVCVLSRPGFEFGQIEKKWRDKIVPVAISGIDISASAIRERIKQGKSIRYLVPTAVESYITRKRLYRQ
ncbi:MAG: nicotinate-nucleotide adenylyltransferase [Candidatus Edwardsbacteria bacterium]|nr:nicotinate-nucleotide adenylyltransferase [Candidatus Edwardsbacteria bacterium]